MRQAREAVKFLAVQRSKEKKTADRRLDALNMQWRDAQIEIAELKASIQENLTKREVPGKVTQSSSSSKVRLGWWELPEETEIDLQEKGHMPKPKRACWWELPDEAVKELDNVTIGLPEPQKGDKGCWWA